MLPTSSAFVSAKLADLMSVVICYNPKKLLGLLKCLIQKDLVVASSHTHRDEVISAEGP